MGMQRCANPYSCNRDNFRWVAWNGDISVTKGNGLTGGVWRWCAGSWNFQLVSSSLEDTRPAGLPSRWHCCRSRGQSNQDMSQLVGSGGWVCWLGWQDRRAWLAGSAARSAGFWWAGTGRVGWNGIAHVKLHSISYLCEITWNFIWFQIHVKSYVKSYTMKSYMI